MFCPKCGSQIPDGSVFCSACGNKIAPVQSAPQRPAATNYQNAPVQKPVSLNFKMPAVSTLVAAGIALIAFIFGFISWIKISAFGYSEHFSILHSDMFELNALFGIAKIFMIIQIVLFVFHAVSLFLNLNKFVPLPFEAKKVLGIAYYSVFSLGLLFNLIGAIAEEYVHPGFGWYISLVFCIAGFILAAKPDLFDKAKTACVNNYNNYNNNQNF